MVAPQRQQSSMAGHMSARKAVAAHGFVPVAYPFQNPARKSVAAQELKHVAWIVLKHMFLRRSEFRPMS